MLDFADSLLPGMYQSLPRNMTYHFNLRITCWPFRDKSENNMLNMSRIQQTVVLDLQTSNILISVNYLPVSSVATKGFHFEENTER